LNKFLQNSKTNAEFSTHEALLHQISIEHQNGFW